MLNVPVFNITSINSTEGLISSALTINVDSEIFNGHFPEHPVVPGASMVQLVKDVLEQKLGTTLQLKIANNLKFLSLIDPQQTATLHLQLNYTIENDLIKINSELTSDDVVYFKFQGVFVER